MDWTRPQLGVCFFLFCNLNNQLIVAWANFNWLVPRHNFDWLAPGRDFGQPGFSLVGCRPTFLMVKFPRSTAAPVRTGFLKKRER